MDSLQPAATDRAAESSSADADRLSFPSLRSSISPSSLVILPSSLDSFSSLKRFILSSLPPIPMPMPILFVDSSGLIEFQVGSAPILISQPHGGRLKSNTLNDRTSGCIEPDSFTDSLVENINSISVAAAAASAASSGQASSTVPFLVYSRLSRLQIDFNRPPHSCADELTPELLRYWLIYHSAIAILLSIISTRFPCSLPLFIDFHGQSHDPRSQIGFVMNREDLLSFSNVDKCSLGFHDSPPLVESLVRGADSFSSILNATSFGRYLCVPSAEMPIPCKELDYYNGGYNTIKYGCSSLARRQFSIETDESKRRDYFDKLAELNEFRFSPEFPSVPSFQFESAFIGIRDSEENRCRFAADFVKSINLFQRKLSELHRANSLADQ